jgi:hypothetical protein
MNTTDNETLESSWHLQILSDCDEVLQGLTRVIGNLRKQRRREFGNVRGLSIFQESWTTSAGTLERSDMA